MAWVQLTSDQTDANSPLNQTLFDQIRANFDALFDGTKVSTGLVQEASIAALAVSAGKLKTAQSTVTNVTVGTGVHLYPTNSSYSFAPQFYCSNAGGSYKHTVQWLSQITGTTLGTSAKMCIYLYTSAFGGVSSTVSAIFRYVQASPPHRFAGVDDWGLFVFLLRDKSTGKLHAMSVAEDPLWDGDWSSLPKGHPARMAEMPHPFADWFPYTDKLPKDHGLEIVLVDMHELQVPTQHRVGEAALGKLIEKFDEWKAAGIDESALHGFEERAASKIETVTMPQWKALEAASKERGEGPVAEMIRKGGLGALAATKEIKNKSDIPSVKLRGVDWSQVVRVLRAE